jgi:hypothetical protein
MNWPKPALVRAGTTVRNNPPAPCRSADSCLVLCKMNDVSQHDPEQHRMRFGCLVVLVAAGVLLFAFAMGAVTTWVSYRDGRLTDPWGEEGPAQVFEMPTPDNPEEEIPQTP